MKSKLFMEFEEKFIIIEREYDSLLRISRRDGRKPLYLIVGEEKLIKMRDDLYSLLDIYGDKLRSGERMEAVNSVALLANAIDIAITSPRAI